MDFDNFYRLGPWSQAGGDACYDDTTPAASRRSRIRLGIGGSVVANGYSHFCRFQGDLLPNGNRASAVAPSLLS
jgi:hypothetical protein